MAAAPRPKSTYKPGPKIPVPKPAAPAKEFGGRDGPEPTRYGDWERKGVAVDF